MEKMTNSQGTLALGNKNIQWLKIVARCLATWFEGQEGSTGTRGAVYFIIAVQKLE